MGKAYAEAGVDIEAADRAVELMKEHIKSTHTINAPQILSKTGSFSGLIDLTPIREFNNPVLVQTVDGAGTKTMIAAAMKDWSVGQCVVNHCVNDALALGATKLLTFQDYLAADRLDPETIAEIMENMAFACRNVSVPITNGETAEMPGVYQAGQHDIVGCLTAIVERDEIIDGTEIDEGDVLIGFPSNGLHTNGYSLARKAIGQLGLSYSQYTSQLRESPGKALLKVHTCYYQLVKKLLQNMKINGIAHITGGGFDNIGRILPPGLSAEIDKEWEIPLIFKLIQHTCSVPTEEMRQDFNMGIGMVLIIRESDMDSVHRLIGPESYLILGKIRKSEEPEEDQKTIFTY